jgi:hypothetical protein
VEREVDEMRRGRGKREFESEKRECVNGEVRSTSVLLLLA